LIEHVSVAVNVVKKLKKRNGGNDTLVSTQEVPREKRERGEEKRRREEKRREEKRKEDERKTKMNNSSKSHCNCD
jgi:hypothetical protein